MKISGMEGIYYGEWKMVNSKLIPNGRGALNCDDNWFFGYVENGEWMPGSQRIIIDMS